MCSLLAGEDEPSADELAERFEDRSSHSAKDAPQLLGVLRRHRRTPRACRRQWLGSCARSASSSVRSSEAPRRSTRSDLLRGLAASPGVYEGPARRVSGPAEFDRIQKGDVLVTESTSEAFNILLPLLGAIVTDSGGLLSHAAIVAREYGIPGVVGTREGTDRITDGVERVRVDGDAGEVAVLGGEKVVPLDEARDDAVFGSKAVGLGRRPGRAAAPARRRALGADRRGRRKRRGTRDRGGRRRLVRPLGGPLAVRSSAVDEDGAEASFAGQHLTLLNVPSCDEVRDALREIWWSANSDSAITYRQRVGLFHRPSVGVVVQALLDPDVAGVMFTQNPVTGADERVIEASWGLGEAVVRVPSSRTTSASTARVEVLERRPGSRTSPSAAYRRGGTVEEEVGPELVERLCLDDDQLEELNGLAARCEEVYGPGSGHRVGVRGRTALPSAVQGGHSNGVVTPESSRSDSLAGRNVLFTIVLGAMLVPLNSTMIAVALPHLIVDSTPTSPPQAGWSPGTSSRWHRCSPSRGSSATGWGRRTLLGRPRLVRSVVARCGARAEPSDPDRVPHPAGGRRGPRLPERDRAAPERPRRPAGWAAGSDS